MPSSTVTVFSRGCLPASGGCCGEPSDQSPSCCRSSSAFGPTTAIVFDLARVERQQAVVLQQHEALARGVEHRGAVVGARDLGRRPREVGPARVLEQAHPELEGEEALQRLVDLRLLQLAALHGLDRALVELRRRHDEVVAGADRHRGRVGVRRRDLLLVHEAADVVPVGHQHAREAPLVLENLAQQPLAGGRRHAVHRLVAGHEHHRAGAGRPLERRQEVAAQLAPRDVGLGRVAAALRLGVAGVVLGRGHDRGRVVEALALVAADEGGAELADQVRVLAEGLPGAAPAHVAGQAQHGREGLVDAGRGHLLGGHAAHPLEELGAPARGHGELRREDVGALPEGVAVDAVLADQERDPEAVLRGEVHRAADLRAEDVQQRPGLPRVDEGEVLAAGVEHQQLADLLLERHAGDEVGHALVDGEGGIPVRGHPGRRLRRHRGRGRHERGRREDDPEGGQEADGGRSWHFDLSFSRDGPALLRDGLADLLQRADSTPASGIASGRRTLVILEPLPRIEHRHRPDGGSEAQAGKDGPWNRRVATHWAAGPSRGLPWPSAPRCWRPGHWSSSFATGRPTPGPSLRTGSPSPPPGSPRRGSCD